MFSYSSHTHRRIGVEGLESIIYIYFLYLFLSRLGEKLVGIEYQRCDI